MGWVFRKDSEFTELFNYHLLRRHQSGMILNTFKRWIMRRKEDFEFTEAIPIGYENTAFVFLLLVGAIAVSVILLLFENIKESLVNVVAKKRKT